MKIGDLICQRFNGRVDDVGIVIEIKQLVPLSTSGTRSTDLATIFWCRDQEDRKRRRYRVRDLEVVNENR